MSEKYFISAQQLLDDSFRLGLEILDSDFRPDFIVGVWRGGTPVGIVVQELLDYFGVVSDHIAIRTSSYEGIGKRSHNIRVHGLNYIVKNVNAEHSLLIVDDVWDTGLSIDAVIEHLPRSLVATHHTTFAWLPRITSRRTTRPTVRPTSTYTRRIAGLSFRTSYMVLKQMRF